MRDVIPEEKQYQYDSEYRDKLGDDAHIPDTVGVYDRSENAGLPPTMFVLAAVVVLIVLAAIALLLLI